ncbi:MAG: hypothetical protein ACFBSG_16050 [Leptolyngbyaceae cyanobacterium]
MHWLALSMLTAFLVVQFSPYPALARLADIPEFNDPTDSERFLDTISGPHRQALLAQLADLPNGQIGLPNFELSEDTFQFSNSELVRAIDLQRDAQAWETVLTEQLEQLFGTQVCIGSEIQACVLTSAAQDWLQSQLERLNLGIAEGMAAAVLSLWQQDPPPQIPWWQQLINFLLQQVVFGLARSLFEVQTFVANLFLMQGVPEVFRATQDIRETYSPTDILLSILNIFVVGSLNPFTLGIYRVVEGLLTDGHTLTPYEIEDKGDGKYWVYVYDSNYPAERPSTPPDLHIEFDTIADTWRYQPLPDEPIFAGDAQSKNIDLTQLSWRQVAKDDDPPYRGPFTCPFCRPIAIADADPTVDITLVGEGQLAVTPLGNAPDTAMAQPENLVPFKGGLSRAVPASYHLPATALDQPLQVTVAGTAAAKTTQRTKLQLAGPGYTADFEDLTLAPDKTLTMYLLPTMTGPELTLVANADTSLSKLSIHLTDDAQTYEFDSSTPDFFAFTERQVAKSSGFELRHLNLPAGQRMAMTAKNDLQRLYFADDAAAPSDYELTVHNRIVIRDRIQIGERQPDFINYTLTYEEDLQVPDIAVEAGTQAYFDYDPAFIDPAEQPREQLLQNFDQRNFPVAIAYEPLTPNAKSGPLRLAPAVQSPIAERTFLGHLRKSDRP